MPLYLQAQFVANKVYITAIAEIKVRLQKYPQAKSEIKDNEITVFPLDENGFAVSLRDNNPNYTVTFAGTWHEEYDDMGKALNAFAFGLSDDCRLQVVYRGNLAYIWIVEEKDKDGEWFPCQWIGCNETGLLAPPLFWLEKKYVYLQNTLLKSSA